MDYKHALCRAAGSGIEAVRMYSFVRKGKTGMCAMAKNKRHERLAWMWYETLRKRKKQTEGVEDF